VVVLGDAVRERRLRLLRDQARRGLHRPAGRDLHPDLSGQRTEPLVAAGDPLAHPESLPLFGERRGRAGEAVVGRTRGRGRREDGNDTSQHEQGPRAHPLEV
jgi:hypothetical protein